MHPAPYFLGYLLPTNPPPPWPPLKDTDMCQPPGVILGLQQGKSLLYQSGAQENVAMEMIWSRKTIDSAYPPQTNEPNLALFDRK